MSKDIISVGGGRAASKEEQSAQMFGNRPAENIQDGSDAPNKSIVKFPGHVTPAEIMRRD